MRADLYLYRLGLARSRSHAAELIRAGVFCGNKRIAKPAEEIADDTPASLIRIESPSRYVSRGGVKLEGALSRFSLDVTDKIALDLGASTGGFTDCLLRHGAKKVFAVDVGHGQLDPSLVADPRVVSMEGVNARTLTPEPCDLAVSDLSFISQSLIYPVLSPIVRRGGLFVSLIKPQFEAGRDRVGSGGIVRDRKVHEDVIHSLFALAPRSELYPIALAPSPITGGDGNREYLALFSVGEPKTAAIDISAVVHDEN